MAYVTYYRIHFDQEQNERVVFLLQKKDGDPLTVIQDYAAVDIKWIATGETDKMAPIIAREVVLTFDIRETDTDYFDEMIDAENDTWLCIGTNDTQPIFHGFVVPDDGAVPFQDRPYNATIKATDGLGLLKQIELVDFNGGQLLSAFTTMSYIACALYQTKLDLPIRVYDNVYHSSMLNRSDDLKYDFVSQTKLDYRTFQKDATTFLSCYETLEIICKRNFRLFYHNGEWVLFRIGMYQYNPTPVYYTLYDRFAIAPVGHEELSNHGTVGKHEIIYPINEDQIKTVKFAQKSVKTIFNYHVWPELPTNNKFERGTMIPSLSGVDYTSYTIDNWEYGIVSTGGNPLFPYTLAPTSNSRAYTKRTFNVFGVELTREIIMTKEPASGVMAWLRSEGIAVQKQDTITISFQQKVTPSFGLGGFSGAAWVYVVNGSDYYLLGNSRLDSNQIRIVEWDHLGIGQRIDVEFSGPSDEYGSVNLESPPIPIDGTLYIAFPFSTANIAAGGQVIRTGFNFEYHPYVAGGYIQVKGDYNLRTQLKNYPDISEQEVFLSDNEHKVFKGTILKLSDALPTTPDWYRYGISESRHYKELTNIAEFNHYWRRFWQIEGTFNGTKYNPENDPSDQQPISFHKTYRFTDLVGDERYFMLVPPVEQDLIKGWFRGTFAEVNMVPSGGVSTVETLTTLMNRIVTIINGTTEAQWDSAGGAPFGTPRFPPDAGVYPNVPNSISMLIGKDYNMTASVATGGAGNSPSITETYNFVVNSTDRLIIWELGTDIAEDNVFTFTAYGHSVAITVVASTVLNSADGIQLGDSSSFNYMF